jgi:hypothetical protein
MKVQDLSPPFSKEKNSIKVLFNTDFSALNIPENEFFVKNYNA